MRMATKNDQEKKQVNQFLLTRGDPNEPCFHCVAKRIRQSQVEKNPKAIINKSKTAFKEQIQPNVVALETGEDGINNQRCLYLDRVNNVSSNLSKKGVQNFEELENMKMDILKKEEELVTINDAQKITAEDMNIIHKIIKLDT